MIRAMCRREDDEEEHVPVAREDCNIAKIVTIHLYAMYEDPTASCFRNSGAYND